MPDQTDVRKAAIAEMGVDYSQFNFPDDTAFTTWLDALALDVITELQPLVGTPPWDLVKDVYFDAATFETDSRMLRRIVLQYYAGALTSESITLGPLKLEPLRTSQVIARDILNLAESYHQRAMSKMAAGGAGGRKGAIKVYNPADKNNNIIVI